MLDGSGVKAMPGSILTPNSGSLYNNKKIQVAKWGAPKEKFILPPTRKKVAFVYFVVKSLSNPGKCV